MEDAQCGRCKITKPVSGFYFRKGKPDTAWCKECYREWHRNRYAVAHDDVPRNCAQCGTVYAPGQRRESAYCSRKCKEVARNAALSADREASKPADRECLHCGRMLPQSMRVDAVFCSEKCNYSAHALQRKLRLRTGQDNKPGYLRLEICKRDRWRCGICGERVNPALEYPHPKCASLDHVLPVSEGGLSEPANLRLVHLVCNLRRRNLGGNEQLALI